MFVLMLTECDSSGATFLLFFGHIDMVNDRKKMLRFLYFERERRICFFDDLKGILLS